MNPQTTGNQIGSNIQDQRKARFDRIRHSLQNISLLQQNQRMAQAKLQEKMEKKQSSTDTAGDRHSNDSEEIQSDFCKVELFLEKYELLEKLGEGSSGVVSKCRKRENGKVFAVKAFQFEDEHLPGLKANFLVMKNLRHRNLISYEALYFDLKKRTAWLVMELIKAPSLETVVLTTEEEIKKVMWQVLDALSYLHRHDVVHRDIKTENILYDPATKQVKIIDFGISKRFKRRGALFDMWTITGTLYYRAPEMFSGGYREGVDVWAAGVLLYKLICGYTPFESIYHSETIQNITKATLQFPPIFKSYSPELKTLIAGMLAKNPQERLIVCSCLRDNWFASLFSPSDVENPKGGSSKNMTTVVERQKIRAYTCRLKSKISLRQAQEDDLIFSEKTSNSMKLNLVRPYTKKINGDQFCCIDQEWQ